MYDQVYASLFTALLLALQTPLPTSTGPAVLANAGNAALCCWASVFVEGFWVDRSNVPVVAGFHEAVDSCLRVRDEVLLLAASWLMTTVLELWGWAF